MHGYVNVKQDIIIYISRHDVNCCLTWPDSRVLRSWQFDISQMFLCMWYYQLNEVRLITESFYADFTWCGQFRVCMSTCLYGRGVTFL